MAYGSGNSFDPNTKVLYFDLKEKDLPAPQFNVQTKVGDKYEDLPHATRISGTITAIQVRERPVKGKTQKEKSVSLTVKDTTATGPEVYFVRIPFTHLGRAIMNRLLSLKGFSGIELAVYNGKPTPQGKVFAKAALRENGELVYEKHERDTLPAIPKVEINGEPVSNPAEINAFFVKEVEALSTRIKAAPAPQEEAAPAGEPEGVEAGAGAKEKDDDVPF